MLDTINQLQNELLDANYKIRRLEKSRNDTVVFDKFLNHIPATLHDLINDIIMTGNRKIMVLKTIRSTLSCNLPEAKKIYEDQFDYLQNQRYL